MLIGENMVYPSYLSWSGRLTTTKWDTHHTNQGNRQVPLQNATIQVTSTVSMVRSMAWTCNQCTSEREGHNCITHKYIACNCTSTEKGHHCIAHLERGSHQCIAHLERDGHHCIALLERGGHHCLSKSRPVGGDHQCIVMYYKAPFRGMAINALLCTIRHHSEGWPSMNCYVL